jgi:hypothetical protein
MMLAALAWPPLPLFPVSGSGVDALRARKRRHKWGLLLAAEIGKIRLLAALAQGKKAVVFSFTARMRF